MLKLIILVPVICPLWVRCVSLYSNTGVLVKMFFAGANHYSHLRLQAPEAANLEEDHGHGDAGGEGI